MTPETAGTVTPLAIYAARQRLTPFLRTTPLIQSDWLSSLATAPVHLKVESMQPTRSFKIRGALNALLAVARGRAASRPTIVTASAGNHGQGIAWAAERLGLSAVVFTPASAPETKKAAIRRHGALLNDEACDYDATECEARVFATSQSALYVSPYNNVDVIAGAGTSALEVLEAMPVFDVLVVPLGGGGLASGMAIAIKAAAPHVRIVGVEVEASAPFAASVAQGSITTIDPQPSLADGLTGNLEHDTITFDLVRRHIDTLVTVSEADLLSAIHGLAAEDHLIAEAAGAAATAAVIARRAVNTGERAVVMLTGGNIDLETFLRAASPRTSPRSLGL